MKNSHLFIVQLQKYIGIKKVSFFIHLNPVIGHI